MKKDSLQERWVWNLQEAGIVELSAKKFMSQKGDGGDR